MFIDLLPYLAGILIIIFTVAFLLGIRKVRDHFPIFRRNKNELKES